MAALIAPKSTLIGFPVPILWKRLAAKLDSI